MDARRDAAEVRYALAAAVMSWPDLWLVLPMHFTTVHFAEDGTEHHDCFVDSDRVVRLPYGRPRAAPVTHWAYVPTLPGPDRAPRGG